MIDLKSTLHHWNSERPHISLLVILLHHRTRPAVTFAFCTTFAEFPRALIMSSASTSSFVSAPSSSFCSSLLFSPSISISLFSLPPDVVALVYSLCPLSHLVLILSRLNRVSLSLIHDKLRQCWSSSDLHNFDRMDWNVQEEWNHSANHKLCDFSFHRKNPSLVDERKIKRYEILHEVIKQYRDTIKEYSTNAYATIEKKSNNSRDRLRKKPKEAKSSPKPSGVTIPLHSVPLIVHFTHLKISAWPKSTRDLLFKPISTVIRNHSFAVLFTRLQQLEVGFETNTSEATQDELVHFLDQLTSFPFLRELKVVSDDRTLLNPFVPLPQSHFFPALESFQWINCHDSMEGQMSLIAMPRVTRLGLELRELQSDQLLQLMLSNKGKLIQIKIQIWLITPADVVIFAPQLASSMTALELGWCPANEYGNILETIISHMNKLTTLKLTCGYRPIFSHSQLLSLSSLGPTLTHLKIAICGSDHFDKTVPYRQLFRSLPNLVALDFHSIISGVGFPMICDTRYCEKLRVLRYRLRADLEPGHLHPIHRYQNRETAKFVDHIQFDAEKEAEEKRQTYGMERQGEVDHSTASTDVETVNSELQWTEEQSAQDETFTEWNPSKSQFESSNHQNGLRGRYTNSKSGTRSSSSNATDVSGEMSLGEINTDIRYCGLRRDGESHEISLSHTNNVKNLNSFISVSGCFDDSQRVRQSWRVGRRRDTEGRLWYSGRDLFYFHFLEYAYGQPTDTSYECRRVEICGD